MNKIPSALTVLALLVGCAGNEMISPDPEEGPSAGETTEKANVEPGVTIVEFDDDMLQLIEEDLAAGKVATRSMGLNSAMDELGIVSMTRLFPDAGEYEGSQRACGLHRFYQVEFDESQPVTKAVATLEGVKGIKSVEKKLRIKPAIFNDPSFSSQWHYFNDGSSGRKAGADINVVPVWEQGTVGSSKVTVAIVDGGIDMAHPDLAASIVPAGKNGSKNFMDNSYVITATSHGTHVAGTVGAINNNGVGVCGIAGGDYAKGIAGVKLLSCQIFSDERKGSGNGATAIVWAAQHGAVIAQNSWGYDADENGDGIVSSDELAAFKQMSIPGSLKSAIDYFCEFAGCDDSGVQLSTSPMKGGLVVFAAGNESIDYDPVGAYDKVVSVGSIDSKGFRSSFSNYGDWVDICAPGSNVYSTVPGSSYKSMSGTSMACPHVSGVAALVVSIHGGPGFTADALREKLIKGAKQGFISANSKIGNLVDALGAISYGGSSIPAKVSSYTTDVVSNNVDFGWKVTGTKKNIKAYAYALMASKDKSKLESFDPKNPSPEVKMSIVQVPSDVAIGAQMTGRLKDLEFDADYFVAIAGCDYFSNYSALSDIKSVRTLVNNPPVIESEGSSFVVPAYQTITIPVRISDPDGHKCTFNLQGGSEAVSLGESIEAGLYNILITGRNAPAGKYTMKITVTDSYGLASTKEIPYEILENRAPVLKKEIDNFFFTAPGEKTVINADDIFMDEDGEPLVYDVEISDRSVVHLNPSGSSFYLSVLGYGLSTVTVTATDALGKKVSSSFKVLVRDADVEYLAYPNPVKTVLNIATGHELEDTKVRIASATGSVVVDQTFKASAFEPAVVDMSGVAPGTYSMTLTFGSRKFEQTIVKK